MFNKLSATLSKPGTKIYRQILMFYKQPTPRLGEISHHYTEMGPWDSGFSEYYNANLKALVNEFENDRVAALIFSERNYYGSLHFFHNSYYWLEHTGLGIRLF